MKQYAIAAAILLTGCRTVRVASPQYQRAPDLTCVVILQTDNAELAKSALAVCTDVVERKGKK